MSEVETNLQPLMEDENIDIVLNQEPLPPQPRQRRKRRQWIITAVVLVLVILVVAGSLFAYMQLTSPPPVQYTQQAVTTGNLAVTISASGPIQANAEFDMNFTTSGQVNAINVQVGQQVKAGQVLATLNSTSLQDALTVAQQNVNNAQVTYDDAVNNGASQSILDSDYNQWQSAQDQLKTAQDNLAATTLIASASARVAAINGVKGEYLGAGSSSTSTQAFMILTDTSKLNIVAQVNEADIASVQVGQPAQFTVTSYTNQTFRASVASIDTVGQTTSNVVTYTVNLTVNQDSLNQAHLYPGMTATVNITTAQRIGVLQVPAAALSFPSIAIQSGELGRSALRSVFSGGGTSTTQGNRGLVLELRNGKLTPVVGTTGLSNGRFTEVLSGLNEGDEVVVGQTGGNTSTSNPGTGGGRNGGGGGAFPIRTGNGG